MKTLYVNLDINTVSDKIYTAVVEGSVTGECLDKHILTTPQGSVVVMVFEKHYWRAGNRLTLTATLDNTQGDKTRVRLVGSGGGESLFRFDWGASESFEEVVVCALQPYTL